MDFIKRHYEKLILVLMLFIFIITMLLVISRVDAVKNARYEVNRRDWKKLETKLSGKEKQFDTESLWKASCENWKVSKYRTPKDKKHENGMENVIFSDLVAYTPLAFCPHCKGSQVLVPLHFFSGKKCPECGNELLTPPARPKFRRRVITADDKDGDGIPDKSERDYNLDPENPNDALQDSDGDGFTNICEHENNTNPRNARNCPPLWYRLQFVKFDYVVLPVQFKALNTNNTKDKSLWDIQINLKERDRRGREREKTELCNLGSEIILDERTYKIVKIEERRHAKKKVEKKQRVSVGVKGTKTETDDGIVDESIIELTEVITDGSQRTPDKLKMQINSPVYSSDKRPILCDVGLATRPQYVLRLNQRFTISTAGNYRETYSLKAFNEDAKTAKLVRVNVRSKENPELDKNGKEMVVTVDSMIPEDSRVELKKEGDSTLVENTRKQGKSNQQRRGRR